MSSDKSQFLTEILAAIAIFFAIFYAIEGLHPWTLHIYVMGGMEFVQGNNPYEATASHGTDGQFKYSPFFAVLMDWLRRIEPMKAGIATWSISGMLAVITGMRVWVKREIFEESLFAKCVIGVAAIAAFIELFVCMSANQANADVPPDLSSRWPWSLGVADGASSSPKSHTFEVRWL